MAVETLNNVSTDMLRWAFVRAGFSEVEAVNGFPQLANWLSKEKNPTFKQLQKFAAKFYVPFGYLFLKDIPAEDIPFPMFRGNAAHTDSFDLNVYDTVMNVRSRQEWLEDYLTDNDIEPSPLVGVVNVDTPIDETVSMLRNMLQLEPQWAFEIDTVDSAVNKLTDQLELLGVFLAYNGVVGNNTHRPLKVSECRGFALVNKIAPYIFVNSADSKAAQMFTLIHEAVHLMLGISAGHAGEYFDYNNVEELYCNKVAAEFLVPSAELCLIWNGDIKAAARKFKVSDVVIARRAYDLCLIGDIEYNDFWSEYNNRPLLEKKNATGGNLYLTSVKRVGRLFAIHVRNAVNSRQLSYTEAYRLTGLHGNTYNHFMTNNI